MKPKPAVDMTAALNRLWTQFLPEIRVRVNILEHAAEALGNGTLSAAERDAAASAAHKLAGVLGTFSLTRGTEVARGLEQEFASGNGPSPTTAAQAAKELREMIEGRQQPVAS